MAIRRITTLWTGIAGTPWLNTFFFEDNEANEVSIHLTIVNNFWDRCRAYIHRTAQYQVQGEVPVFDPTTGELLTVRNGAGFSGSGNSTQYQQLPPATQFNIRLRTDTIVRNRRVLGHIYVPGLTTHVGTPQPTGAPAADIEGAANAMVNSSAAAGPLTVWSRPKVGNLGAAQPGASANVKGCDRAVDYSVMRSRRD